MSVRAQPSGGALPTKQPTIERAVEGATRVRDRAKSRVDRLVAAITALTLALQLTASAEDTRAEAERQAVIMEQMGARRIGSLAIGIGVVGIVLNKMSNLQVVNGSDGVINVGEIFAVAGDGLNLLVIGVIIAAAAVLLSLWSGF